MATIIEQINALAEAKADIQAAVVEKGGVVSGDTLAGLADDVRAIPQSGDFDWSSIGYTGMPSEMLRGLDRARYYKELWDSLDPKPTYNSFFRGVVGFSVLPDIGFSDMTDASYAFNGCTGLIQVPPTADFSNVSVAPYLFAGCYALQNLPDTLDFSNVLNAERMFQGCMSLLGVDLDLPRATRVAYMLYQCDSLKKCHLRIPQATGNFELSSTSLYINDVKLYDLKNSIKLSTWVIDAEGVHGLIDSLADCSNKEAQTIMLRDTTKANMSDETRALAASKNWTIA